MTLNVLPVRKLLRLPGMDYRFVGPYFVTACTLDRAWTFGTVRDGVMQRNRMGELVLQSWRDLPLWNPWVLLDEFVVMPNHVHGILAFHAEGDPPGSPRPSLGATMGRFKARAAADINRERGTPGASVWQRGYYEHIIRNERAWQAIGDYIRANPAHWPHDPENRGS